MIKPDWMNAHPEKRARKTYEGAVWICATIGFIALISINIALSVLLRRAGISSEGVFPLLMVTIYFAATSIGQACGVRALKRAGLVRETSEFIPRTATSFAGETIEFHGSSLWGQLCIITLLACLIPLMTGFAYFLWQARPTYIILVILCASLAFISAAMAVQMAINIKKPDLRVDEQGITLYKVWIKPRFVRWENIACLERKRVWGLPPRYDLDGKPTETIALQDANGENLLVLNPGNVANSTRAAMVAVWMGNADSPSSKNAMPPQMRDFIAEIERRLRAATPTTCEETSDG